MADAKSNWAENAVLDWLLGGSNPTRPTTRYVTVFTAAPTDVGGGTELGVTRQAATFSAAASGTTSNTNTVTFASVPAGVVTHFGVFDASTSGNLLYYGALTTPRTAQAGDSIVLPIGELDISEN